MPENGCFTNRDYSALASKCRDVRLASSHSMGLWARRPTNGGQRPCARASASTTGCGLRSKIGPNEPRSKRRRTWMRRSNRCLIAFLRRRPCESSIRQFAPTNASPAMRGWLLFPWGLSPLSPYPATAIALACGKTADDSVINQIIDRADLMDAEPQHRLGFSAGSETLLGGR
jgi:hypothetical protein